MGGTGSGNWPRWDTKLTVEDYYRLDIRWLFRKGLLGAGMQTMHWSQGGKSVGSIGLKGDAKAATLYFRTRPQGIATWQEHEQRVTIAWTACSFGGSRPWWLCPACCRRVAVIYMLGSPFACRHCHGIRYVCQSENVVARAFRRASKSEALLGTNAYEKPKGMHWKTYSSIQDRISEDRMHADGLLDQMMLREMDRWDS